MSDDKNRNFGFGGGFLGDALKDLRAEYSSDPASKNKKKFSKAKVVTEPDYDSDRTFVSPSGGRTPAYCSPEQAAAQLLTRRTDIYSWGVSIMEMYLGRKPWAHSGQLTGPLAGLACRDYFEMCTEHPIPEALQELLAHCMEHDPDLRPDDFSIVESELLKIYRSITGISYSRPEPKAAPDTPDSLNNKALSYLDLGLNEEAIKLSNKLRFTGIGRQIVYIKDPYTVALTPLQPGEKETEAVNDFNIPADFAVSPDGLFLAVAGGEGKNTVYIYKLEWDLQYPEVRK